MDTRDSDHGEPRAKRARYALVACVQCKRRKTKCVRPETSSSCERCSYFGEDCTFPDRHVPAPATVESEERFDGIEAKIAQLQHQVQALQHELDVVRRHPVNAAAAATDPSAPAPPRARRRPRFVGRTRSAFSFDVAGNSLRDMGVSTDMPSFSRDETPDASPTANDTQPGLEQDPLLIMTKHEALQHVNLFSEEVHPVYPFVNIPALKRQIEIVFGTAQNDPQHNVQTPASPHHIANTLPLRVVIAIGIVMDVMGATRLSQQLVESVEAEIFGLSITSDAFYNEAIATTLLSLYYFHIDQELLAWRVNGIAVRMMLEMGLHRKDIMTKTFTDPDERLWAIRLFWCMYVLDRRWSFGTSLPFAVQDADIDPELPEPDEALGYLQCMMKYGRICSQIWQALPSFGALSKTIPEDTVSYLEFKVQGWINSIPQHLQLAHFPGDHFDSNEAHNRIELRLATLLYLRGNHALILVNRHALLSHNNIRAYAEAAQRIVGLAKDSVRALVWLHERSNIYRRQQVPFNYFLVSALAVIFLAVCHDPSVYGPQCEESFHTAVEQLRVFSVQSLASRRLWKSINGLMPELQKLSQRHATRSLPNGRPSVSWDDSRTSRPTRLNRQHGSPPGQQRTPTSSALPGNSLTQHSPQTPQGQSVGVWEWDPSMIDTTIPDIDRMAHDLTNWYEYFGTIDKFQGLENGAGFNIEGNIGDSVDLSHLLDDFISG